VVSEAANRLDAALRDAHATGDGERLARLYTRAADEAEAAGDVDAACFFLTHAWVFALQVDAAGVDALENRLVRHGRLRAVSRSNPARERSAPCHSNEERARP